jgi:putative endonuclease
MASTTTFWERQRIRWIERALTSAAVRPDEPAHLTTGRRGELAAYSFLRRSGYTIVARGWRSHICPGDLDLIAWEDQHLCVIEVKTRTTRDVATAESSIDNQKRRTLRMLTRRYLRLAGIPQSAARFDVVSVYFEADRAPEITLLRNAFSFTAQH